MRGISWLAANRLASQEWLLYGVSSKYVPDEAENSRRVVLQDVALYRLENSYRSEEGP
jgi:hypothetical protein